MKPLKTIEVGPNAFATRDHNPSTEWMRFACIALSDAAIRERLNFVPVEHDTDAVDYDDASVDFAIRYADMMAA